MVESIHNMRAMQLIRERDELERLIGFNPCPKLEEKRFKNRTLRDLYSSVQKYFKHRRRATLKTMMGRFHSSKSTANQLLNEMVERGWLQVEWSDGRKYYYE